MIALPVGGETGADTMKTYGDFFTGFGGATIGAKAAGLDVLFGVEYDEKLAAIYRQNLGDHIRVADVTTIDISTLPRVDIFHASPPCTNASVANNGAGESPQDLAMAQAVVRYLAQHQPDVFTLENVWGYREFESWHVIARALLEIGYAFKFWHVNMANYGVPQTRKRMIVIARRDGKHIELPEQTHAQNPTPGLFTTKRRWVSWYEAIEDLIPTLPPSQFALWQLKRLPDDIKGTFIVPGGNSTSFSTRNDGEPVRTIGDTERVGNMPKALLVEASNATGGSDRQANQPSQAVTTPTGGRVQRALVSGRVVRMTPRCMARFQSFLDEYELPESASLAVKGIGNAVPPLFMQKLYEAAKA